MKSLTVNDAPLRVGNESVDIVVDVLNVSTVSISGIVELAIGSPVIGDVVVTVSDEPEKTKNNTDKKMTAVAPMSKYHFIKINYLMSAYCVIQFFCVDALESDVHALNFPPLAFTRHPAACALQLRFAAARLHAAASASFPGAGRPPLNAE